MSAATLDNPLLIEQGATFRQTFTWQTGSPSVPVDLTGYSAHMQVRDAPGTLPVLLDLSTANGGIVLGGTAGTVTLYASATTTAALAWSKGRFDLDLTAPNGDVIRLLQGGVVVSPEVTSA